MIASTQYFHIQSPGRKDAESKVEKTSNLLKDKMFASTEAVKKKSPEEEIKVNSQVEVTEESKEVDLPRPSLWDKIVKEVRHYYNGFKLLFLESRIAFRLLRRVLNGHTLTRRERRQFTRTAADLFRLVPFSLFIIIPFMELALPIFLKLFPNMLPSTFSEASKERETKKKELKAKLEMAKFLQDTLEETAMRGVKQKNADPLNKKFSEFMINVRTNAQQPTNEEIMKYSRLFENELTLDNLTRQQLIALCQILDVSTLGNIPPNHILRFQLRMKIRSLEADDKMIVKEGIEKLDIGELQQACRDRGMRAMGLSQVRLKHQLEQWLDLHLKRNIPISLLLFSRSLYLPENLPTEEVFKSTLSALPKSIEDATSANIAEISGEMDNTIRLKLLKQEEDQIKQEQIENVKEETKVTEKKKKVEKVKETEPLVEEEPLDTKSQVPSMRPEVVTPIETLDLSETLKSEIIIDRAQTFMSDKLDTQDLLTPTDIKEISQIIDNLPQSEKSIISDEIYELKKDVDEYNEDVKEIEELSSSQSKLTETKSAKILSKRVQKLISDMDVLMANLCTTNKSGQPTASKNNISIEELMSAITMIRGQSDESREKKLLDILKSLDSDNDGRIDDLSDVIKVFDLIEQENVEVSKSHLSKLLTLLEKEKIIEFDQELEKLYMKPPKTAKTTKAID